MLEPDNSSNNPPSPPSPPIPPHQPKLYILDSEFYYRDGNTYFLAGNTEFKFQASLLDADADVYDYEFKQMMEGSGNGFEDDTSKPGVGDARSIVLPDDVTSDEFRDLLMVAFGGQVFFANFAMRPDNDIFYGSVANDTFLAFLKALQTSSGHNPLMVSRLTSIGYLGCRFGMKRLDAWSQTQIHTVLEKIIISMPRHEDDWCAPDILQLVKYMQKTTVTDYRHKILDLMRHIMSVLVQEAYKFNDQAPQGKIIDICADLYKEKDLLMNSPGFFGFIFAVIVSLGHQSSIWANYLTREDRRVLYVAHATFTCLGNHADLQLGWLKHPSEIKGTCIFCSPRFNIGWQDAFSRCNGLKSYVPLEDIRHVVALADYRIHFRGLGRASCIADESCGCEVLGNLERRIESLYCGLTEKYKTLADTV